MRSFFLQKKSNFLYKISLLTELFNKVALNPTTKPSNYLILNFVILKIINNYNMKTIDKIYINGEFITPNGTEYFDLISPTTNKKLGKVLLGCLLYTSDAADDQINV